MTPPRFNLLYFKNVLDVSFQAFVEGRQDCFARDSRGVYVFTGDAGRGALAAAFRKLAGRELASLLRPFDPLNPEYFFIIGGCDPAENILLAHKTKRFPERLSRLVSSGRCGRYLLREKDVDVDMAAFDAAFAQVFDELFSSRKAFEKAVGRFPNAFMIRHGRLGCYSMFKVLKYVLGAQSCVNLYAERLAGRRECLVAVNDLIARYSAKSELNSSPVFKRIVGEVREYVEECVASVAE